MMTLTVVFDNYSHESNLQTEWGFSCCIEGLNKPFLFDTGSDGAVLLNNMSALGVDPKKVKTCLISHDHWDHTGGLGAILEVNPDMTVYMLDSFSRKTKNIVKKYNATLVEIGSLRELLPGAYSTGTLGQSIREQSLVLEAGRGLAIITGCAHPGVAEIVEHVQSSFKRPIHMILGGFHLAGASDPELERIISSFREFGVQKVGPSHCSGDRCRYIFQARYGRDYIELGVGQKIVIE
jgi:7,8-dihydropterin-6-yl-methyl-4-(beta-D-ribofuranosyl)aminobenzene 5'-phosphate synthase